ncbi:MAG: EAL domain-containing protein [Geminicoccaceae bacterium]
MSVPPDLDPLLDLVGDAIVLLRRRDHDQPAPRIVWTNRALRTLLAVEAGALEGRGVRVLRGAGMPPVRFARFVAAVAAGQDFEGPLLLASGEGEGIAVDARGAVHPTDEALYVLTLAGRTAGRSGQDLLGSLRAVAFYGCEIRHDGSLALARLDPAIETLVGVPESEVRARGGMPAIVLPADLGALQRRNQLLLSGRAAAVDYRVRLPDGRIRWLRDSARPSTGPFDDVVVRIDGAITDVSGEHIADDQHRWRERVAGLLAHALHALVVVIDVDGRVPWASAEPATPFADAVRTAAGATLESAFTAAEADLWLGWIDQCLAARERVAFRFDWRRGSDSAAVEVLLAPLGDDAVLAVARTGDVARRAVEAVPASLLAALAEPAFLLGPDLSLQDVSPAAAEALRAPPDRLRGRPFGDLLRGDAETVAARLATLLAEARAGEVEGVPGWSAAAQAERLAAIPVALAGEGGGLLVVRLPRDVSGQVAPDRSAPWLAALIDSVADGVVGIDAQGRVESFSRAAEAIFGLERGGAIGRTVEQLLTAGPTIQPGSLLRLLHERAERAGETVELFARRPSGEVVPVEVTVMPMAAPEGRVLLLIVRDVTERRQTEETLRSLAYIDPLTALPNRLLFHDRLNQAVERARRTRQMLAVMLVDLDRFKLVNDSLGLEKGDQMLRAVGERLAGALRRSDTIARLGGDEFLVLTPGAGNAEAAAKVAQKLLDALRPGFAINGHELTTGASIGIALYPYDGDDADSLIKNADTALSQAKLQGRNHYQFYTNDMNATAFERLMLESRLRKALQQGELTVYYQPQVSLRNGEVVGVEALLRWFHPDLGMVPPAEFIPLAEDTGLIVPIGIWALRTACREVMRWHAEGFPAMRLAVNVSGRQFEQRDLADGLAEVLAETGFPPALLELELTESVIMRHASDAVRRLRELTGLGVQLAVDDFGTGYSSLSYLRTFPIRSLKIDRSFVRDIDRDENGRVIPQAVIALAGSLDLKVVAEGVESEAQLAFLRAAGCEEMQGYLFARPLPAEDVLTLLRSGRRLPLP